MRGGAWAYVFIKQSTQMTALCSSGGLDLGLRGRISAWGGWTHKGSLEEVMSHHTGRLLSLVPKPEIGVLLGHRGPET